MATSASRAGRWPLALPGLFALLLAGWLFGVSAQRLDTECLESWVREAR